jgi:uncharacterized protein
MQIECPECSKKVEVPADFPARPFCSQRCKLLDLGRWFNEEYRIPGPPVDSELASELGGSEVPEA